MSDPAAEKLIYGTAWKGDQTADLVYAALKSGFRAIATAAQPKHYREDLVGEGIKRAISDGVVVAREDIFIQTTFTPYPAQNPGNAPYDADSSLDTQVETSLANSLATLATFPSVASGGDGSGDGRSKPYLDALVLHIPYANPQHTQQVWLAMSRAVREGYVRQLGVSNTSLPDLENLVNWSATHPESFVKPTIVQNRFYPGHLGDFDHAVRQYCCCSGSSGSGGVITYQAFGFLRNKALVEDQLSVVAVARKMGVSAPVALYALMIEALGPTEEGGADFRVLNGTTKEERMREDVMDVRRVVEALRYVKKQSGIMGSDDSAEKAEVGSSNGEPLEVKAMMAFRMGFGEGME